MNKNKKNSKKNRQQIQPQGYREPKQSETPVQQKQSAPKQPEPQPQELSYYRLLLLSFLKESYHELVDNSDFIAARAARAAEAYSEAIRTGSTHDAAAEIADQVLFAGLHFSKYNVIVTVLWNEFGDEVPQGNAQSLALQLLPVCEEVFAKYPLSDDFLYEPAFDNLYTEITGTILIWLDEYGIQ